MDAAIAVTGVVVIGLMMSEVFKDLFHPSDSSALTDWLGRRLFNLFRPHRPLLTLAGPLTVVVVILVWVTVLVIGFALVYYQWYPDGFRTSLGVVPAPAPRLWTALYFSFETLVTLGYGDLVPNDLALRFISVFESLIGFGLLTASVSSIVLLYPALSRLRLLALEVAQLTASEEYAGISVAASGSHEVVFGLAQQVTSTVVDLVHFPVIYYFAARDPTASIARWTLWLDRLACDGRQDRSPAMRMAAGALDCALDDLAALFKHRFVHADHDERRTIFEALAKDHAVDLA